MRNPVARAPGLLALGGCLLLGASCAQQMGENAARGATQGLRDQAAARGHPNAPPAAVAASNVVAGSLFELESPAQLQRLQDLTTKMTAAAVTSALDTLIQRGTSAGGAGAIERLSATAMRSAESQLAAALGAQGNGPLARSLSATADQLAAAAARGAASNLLPGCDPRQSPGCVERQISELARITGSGVARGIKQELRWAMMFAVFVSGFLFALFGLLLWQLWTTRRALREARAHGLLRRPVEQE